MDRTKQPGIRVEFIILISDEFNREPNPTDTKTGLNIKQDFHFEKYFNNPDSKEESTHAQLTVTLNLDVLDGTGNICYHLKVKYLGSFQKDLEDSNMDLLSFINNHAPAIIYPYIREHVSSLTLKAGIPALYLPPINLIALMQESEK